MKNRCPLLVAAAVTLLAAPSFPKVPLREAVARALRMNRGVAAQRLSEDAAGLRLREAGEKRKPRLDAGGALAYASDSPHVRAADMPIFADRLPAGTPPTAVLLESPRVFADLRVGVVQPVFTGGSLSRAIEAADAGGRAEREMTRALESRLAADVRSSFFGVRALQARKDSLDMLAETLRHHLARLETVLEAGLGRKSDVLETRSRAEEALQAGIDLDRAIADEKARFRRLCGTDFEDVEAGPVPEPPDFPAALAACRASHPLLAYFDRKEQQAAALRRAAEGTRRPQVSAFGQVHAGRPGLSLFDPKFGVYVLGGVSVDLPVFDAGKGRAETALAELERRRVEERRAEAAEDLEARLRSLYELKASLEAKAASAGRMRDWAAEDARLKARLLEESQISNLEYLAALSQLEKSVALARGLGFEIDAVKVQILALAGAEEETS